MIADCTGVVLAGGDSRRMGSDKTRLSFGGKTLLQRAVDSLRGVFPQVLVSVREPREDIDAPLVFDEHPGAGPLAGLCAALAKAETPWVFAIAADMPFLDPELIRHLAGQRAKVQAVVPVIQGYPQPLAAFYATSALPALREELAGTGKHSLRGMLERLNVCLVPETGLQDAETDLLSFVDLDTPEDLIKALDHARRRKTP